MLAELFSLEQFIHLFPSIFAILLCFISKLDHYWIDWKLQNEIGRGTPNPPLIAAAKQIANGAAALNIHIINVLLFSAGAIFAVFDWPSCLRAWPLLTFLVLSALILYEVLITALPTYFESYDRQPVEPSTSPLRAWRWFRCRPVSAQLRWEQIAFNLIIVVLIVLGVVLGGAKDHRGFCTTEGAATTAPKTD